MRRLAMAALALGILVAACGASGPTPTTVTTTPAPTAPLANMSAPATIAATAAPTVAATTYEGAFGDVGSFNGVDPLPLLAGHSYRVDWTYGAQGTVCAFVAGLQGTGSSVGVQFANEASQGQPVTDHATIEWKPENGSDPRLVVVSQCLWVLTIKEVRT